LTPDDIDVIAAQSRAGNDAAGLTGLLLHQAGRFYAVLEGPQRRVFGRMESIATDRRHSGLRILREEPVQIRRFENWSFGWLPGSDRGASGDPEEFILRLCRRS
jgi:hypothetical protein